MRKLGELYIWKTPNKLWQEISINIIGPLPKSNRQRIIVVIVDQFTKIIRLKTIIIAILSEDIAKIYRDKI